MSASASEPTPHNPFIGKVLGGRYQVDRLIGRGGMGLVYLGREVLQDREVVLKMLAPHWADDKQAIARFKREGRRLSELRHPSIVELFDIGREGEQSYIVMEFIRGIPLRKVLSQKKRLSLAEFLPIATQILEAVSYAHASRVMLRDIKPSNVMLTERDGKANVVKVLDFGLAKMVEGDDVDVTKTNVIGTAGFLAPELIRGERSDVRVDVYAVSIMFFIMLTGVSPILGENDGAILYNHVHGTPKRFEDVLPEGTTIPEPLQALIYRCMAKTADERPANAGEMLELLRACAEPEQLELPEATPERTAEIDRYWERKYEGEGLNDENPSSALWTRPRLERLLADGEAQAEAKANEPPSMRVGKKANTASSGNASEADDDLELDVDIEGDEDDVAVERDEDAPLPDTGPNATDDLLATPEPGRPQHQPPQPSAAVRARTSGRLREATRVGLPSADPSAPAVPIEAQPGPAGGRRPKPARTSASSNMERSRPGPPPPPPPGQRVSKVTLMGAPNPAFTGPAQPSVTTRTKTDKTNKTKVPKPKPKHRVRPTAPPRDVSSDDPVGPLHMELAAPAKRKRKPTQPLAPPPAPPRSKEPELDAPVVPSSKAKTEVDRKASRVETPKPPKKFDPADLSEEIPAGEVEEAKQKPIAPLQSKAAEPKGVSVVLIAAVTAALVLGGFVIWLAVGRDTQPAETIAAKPKPANRETAVGASKAAAPSKPAASVLDETPVDPDAPGALRVEGPPGATAFINDEDMGTVPVDKSLEPGLYSIRVEADGFDPWETEVQLQPEGSAKLVAAMQEAAVVETPSGRTPRGRTGRSGRGTRRGSNSTPSTPEPPKTPPETSEPPASKPDPKPDPKPEPKAEPKPEPKDDGVFMKGDDNKDDGIFLPVGKDK